MRVSFLGAEIQVKNGETKYVKKGELWATEGNAVVVGVDLHGFTVTSQPVDAKR